MTAPQAEADREKQSAALSSVGAAVFLTGIKLVVGVMTGSLGLMAEAAHSGLDLVAAGLTLVAVRVSGRPADAGHTYGHGKVENLSALAETFLLLVTCVWIISEAIERLFFKQVAIENSIFSFLVMGTSIVVDYARSQVLRRAALKHKSQALEADALHFSSDIWSSAVVIVGLGLVKLAEWLEAPWLIKGDAIAALGVCVVVIYVSINLGRRSVAALVDGVPANLREDLEKAVRVPGVVDVPRVRVRQSGAESFVDVVLTVGRHATLEQSHEVASQAERAAQSILPRADVVVHVEPDSRADADLPSLARAVAARHGLLAHDIRFYDVLGRTWLELHLELAPSVDVSTAHAYATAFERDLREAAPAVGRIVTHLEPADGAPLAACVSARRDQSVIRRVVDEVARRQGIRCEPHGIEVRRMGAELSVAFHCTMDGEIPLASAHIVTENLERALRERLPDLRHVTIHIEPPHSTE